MSRKHLHIHLRGNVWQFRIRIPQELVETIGKEAIKCSLKTPDRRIAEQRGAAEYLKAQALFDDARRKLARATGATKSDLSDAEIVALTAKWFSERQKRAAIAAQVDIANLQESLAIMTDYEDGVPASIVKTARDFLTEQGLDTPRGSQSFHRLCGMLREAQIEIDKQLLARFSTKPQTLNPHLAGLFASVKQSPQACSLEELLKRFRRDQPPVKSSKTEGRRVAEDRLFLSILGASTPIDTITREDAKRVVEVVKRLPINWANRFPNVSPAKVLQMKPDKVGKPMAAVTANSYLRALSSLFVYAENEHLITRSPAKDLRLPSSGVGRKERRNAFTIEELQCIFDAPVFTGCREEKGGWNKPGPARPRQAYFWAPLIAAFTGMRSEEILQLTEDDFVTTKDGIDLIRIRDVDGKRVKSPAAKRDIPIHPTLKSIGLLDFVEQVRRRGAKARLFPEVKRAVTGYHSDNFSKWFARFLDTRDLRNTKLGFHSFRHTVEDRLKEAAVPQSRIDAIMGHAEKGMSGVYGSGFQPETLAAEIAKIEYPGLDLDHLKS